MKPILAIDIGASSGRHIVLDEMGNLIEVFRFETGFVEQEGHLINDIATLWSNVLEGIRLAFMQYPNLASLSIDTWGVDYVLLDQNGKEILPVYAYRDGRTSSVIEKVHSRIPFSRLYSLTGIQFQPFNSIYQLYADKEAGRLDQASSFLLLPDYLLYKLTGIQKHEYTNSTTMGMVKDGAFCQEILDALALPKHLFPALSQPGEEVGELTLEIQTLVGGNCRVLLCASHDTASAVEGIPMEGEELYISSGTWSLLGAKIPCVLSDPLSQKANYSNEGGVGYIRYQKNIMGMWVVNQLRKQLCPNKPFPQIVEEAQKSSFQGTVDVNEEAFLAPSSMKQAFLDALGEKDLNEEDLFNCAFLSLAKSYAQAIEELETNTGKTYSRLYIVGGGAKNAYLNRLTEESTKKQVLALPIEATALGNISLQRRSSHE